MCTQLAHARTEQCAATHTHTHIHMPTVTTPGAVWWTHLALCCLVTVHGVLWCIAAMWTPYFDPHGVVCGACAWLRHSASAASVLACVLAECALMASMWVVRNTPVVLSVLLLHCGMTLFVAAGVIKTWEACVMWVASVACVYAAWITCVVRCVRCAPPPRRRSEARRRAPHRASPQSPDPPHAVAAAPHGSGLDGVVPSRV